MCYAWEEQFHFLFCSNHKHLQLQNHILIAVAAKGIFSVFKAESILFSPSFSTYGHSSNPLSCTFSLSLNFLTLDFFKHLPKLCIMKIYKLASPTVLFLLRIALGLWKAVQNDAVCYMREAVAQTDTEK